MPKVEIITIGDEILIGQIVDTNSAWMAVELNKTGFEIAQITSVHDDENHILEALDNALMRADIVLITGGIGPTKDDITKQTLCKYFNTRLVFSEAVLHDVETLLRNRKKDMNELNRSQAMVPENCTVISNTVGTAPITWFDKNEKIVVSMPGVPNEMKHAMSSEIIPRLKERFKTSAIIHKSIIVQGYPESELAIKIAEWENSLPQNIHLAYLPNYGIVKLRLSAYSNDALVTEFAINQQIDSLTNILGKAIVSYEDTSLEAQIGNILTEKGKTLATAESCTGGNIARLITSIPGSSVYFKGSVVAYANEIKTSMLHVDSEAIDAHGAVSQEVVKQMAEGVRNLMKTDYGIATSGIAGPGGGSAEKPVGTVWIAISSENETICKEFRYGNSRIPNIERTTQTAFLMLKEII